MKQYKYSAEGLTNLAVAVMEQAHEDMKYYPDSTNPDTLRKAAKIREDAAGFIKAMQERYGNAQHETEKG